ncbi:hypothetical protein RJT34_16466 [Clitoria ternatea]|uniref:Arf-GAP domain-containing protein n=1 Tax=Clitoria ternatea TaxID=43366 RepID=A0AAN9J8Q5_CLITE
MKNIFLCLLPSKASSVMKNPGFEELNMKNRKTTGDERAERVIRGLLKLPENRRCINCNLLGPQYVCTTFSTFVCTNCSGIHREFTHRIKSVSMAKFTPEEVTALQAGGNEDEKESQQGSKKSNSLRFELKNPPPSPSTTRSDDPSFKYLYDESKSPRFAQKYNRPGSFTRSPIKFEVVDDRFRDDDYRTRRLLNIESKLRQLSIDGQKNVDRSQLPAARPLGEIFRETSSPQASHSSGGGSVEGNPSERKTNHPESSIDWSTKSQASDVDAGVKPEAPSLPDENNWAVFETSTENNGPKTPNTSTSETSTIEVVATSAKTPLDLLLFELSGPVTPVTGGMSQVSSGDNNNEPTTTTTEENSSNWDFPPNNADAWALTTTTAPELPQPSHDIPPQQAQPYQTEDSNEASHALKSLSLEYLPSVSVGSSSTSTTQPTSAQVRGVASNNQPLVNPNSNDSSLALNQVSSQTTSKPTQDTRPYVGFHPSKVETRSSGRMELPEPPSVLPVASKSINPFDVTEGRSLGHTSSLPSMASLHGVQPAVPSRIGLMHASSIGSLGTMASQSPSYALSFPMGVYFDQVNNEVQPLRPQRAESFNGDLTGFGSLDKIQQSYVGHMTPSNPISFSNTRRNPFDE